jgi:hypothetical protein
MTDEESLSDSGDVGLSRIGSVAIAVMSVQLGCFVLACLIVFEDYPPPWLVFTPGIYVVLVAPALWAVCGILALFARSRGRRDRIVAIVVGAILLAEVVFLVVAGFTIPMSTADPFD